MKSGKQFRADTAAPTPPDHNVLRSYPEIVRQNPGKGYRHVLLVRHVRTFLGLLPDWQTLAVGLNTILLAPGRPYTDGFHRPGLVALCAPQRLLAQTVESVQYIEDHHDLLDRLGVPVEPLPEGHRLHFTPTTLRGFQLLHVLLHELGHHHDRMTTRSQHRASRGESFAEAYARRNGDLIWSRYFSTPEFTED